MLNERVTYAMPAPALRVFETEEDMSSVFKTTKLEWSVSLHSTLVYQLNCLVYLCTGVFSELFQII